MQTRTITFTAPTLEQLDAGPADVDHWGESLDREYAPLREFHPNLLTALQRYGWHRMRPGKFLQAVLANDFADAVLNRMPARCRGSRERIDAWVENRLPADVEG